MFRPLEAPPPRTLGEAVRGRTRGPKKIFLSFSTVGGAPSPDPRGARVRLQRCSGGVPGARNLDRWRRPLPGPSGRRGSPPTVRSGCTRFSKRVSARNRKPSFRERRPPGDGPDQPQDSCPTLGGPVPGRLRRHTPARTLVLFRQLRRPTGKRDPPSEGPRRPAQRWRQGGRLLRPAGSPPPAREGPRRGGGPRGPFLCAPPGADRSVARPRRPVRPSRPTTEPVAGFQRSLPGLRGDDPPCARGGPSGEHRVSRTLPARPPTGSPQRRRVTRR